MKRKGAALGVVMVTYATADNSAVATGPNLDYASASGTLTFPNGVTTRTLRRCPS